VRPVARHLGHVGLDRRARERMREAQGQLVAQHAGSDERLGGAGGSPAVQAGERRGVGAPAVVEDRDRARERLGVRPEAADARQDHGGDAGRHERRDASRARGIRMDPLLTARPQQLDDQPWVAGGDAVAGGREGDRGGRSEAALHELPAGRLAERRKPQRRRGLVDPLAVVGRKLVLAGRADEQEAVAVEPSGDVAEGGGGGRVGPLDVVDQHDDRLMIREPPEQPVEPVRDGGGGFRDGVGARRDEGTDRRGGSGEERVAPRGVEVEPRPLDELSDDAERQLALELGRSREEDAARRPAGRQLAQQRRLARARGTRDHHG
jgi:hypothetical protein